MKSHSFSSFYTQGLHDVLPTTQDMSSIQLFSGFCSQIYSIAILSHFLLSPHSFCSRIQKQKCRQKVRSKQKTKGEEKEIKWRVSTTEGKWSSWWCRGEWWLAFSAGVIVTCRNQGVTVMLLVVGTMCCMLPLYCRTTVDLIWSCIIQVPCCQFQLSGSY